MYIADIGTGSGAIAIALAVERPLAHVIATDVSEACVDVARTNAARLDVINLEIRCGDLFEPLAGERFDLLVSNPPYVAAGDPHLALGDVRFEPRLALEAGGDGMEVINRLTDLASHHLIGGGAMIVEHGFEQGALVRDAMARGGLVSPTTFRDYAGLERVTTARNL